MKNILPIILVCLCLGVAPYVHGQQAFSEIGSSGSEILRRYGEPCSSNLESIWYCQGDDRVIFFLEYGIVNTVMMKYARESEYEANKTLQERLLVLKDRSRLGKRYRYIEEGNTYQWYEARPLYYIKTGYGEGTHYYIETVQHFNH